mgnify:CR=1 FL=1
MKLLKQRCVLILFALLLAAVPAMAQGQLSQKVSVELTGVTLHDVLLSIEKQVDFKFMVGSADAASVNVPSVNMKDATVKEVLDAIECGRENLCVDHNFTSFGCGPVLRDPFVSCSLPYKRTSCQNGWLARRENQKCRFLAKKATLTACSCQNRSPPFQKAARAVSHPKHSTFHFKMPAASPSRDNLEMAFPSRDNPEPACKK